VAQPFHRAAAVAVCTVLVVAGSVGASPPPPTGSAATSPFVVGGGPWQPEFGFPGQHKLLTLPDDGFQTIYDFISSAHKSVDMTMYELDDTTVVADLIADVKRGVDVHVILDGREGPGSPYYAPVEAELAANGVHVVWSNPAYYFTHQKTITVDGQVSLIMSGNLDSYYYSGDRDYAVFDNDPWDVHAIVQTFNADFVYAPITPSDGSGDLVWSPTDSQDKLLGLINGAHRSLYVEELEMDSTPIINALVAASKRGVDVHIVINADSEYTAAFNELAAAGVHISNSYTGSDTLYVHAKAIVADYGSLDERFFVGSENWSDTSLNENRELGIILPGWANQADVNSLMKTFKADFAAGVPYVPTATS
jgi:cardiolipin synthase A/B